MDFLKMKSFLQFSDLFEGILIVGIDQRLHFSPSSANLLAMSLSLFQMDTQEMVIMEYKKEITAADRELVKQDHQIIGEVVVETSDNNGQAVEQPHNQGAPNQHHQTAARHPPPPPPAPQQQQQHLAKGLPVTAPAIRQAHPEHTPANRPQQWVPKDEGEERVGLASAQPITVITAPKTRMINSSGNIRYVNDWDLH